MPPRLSAASAVVAAPVPTARRQRDGQWLMVASGLLLGTVGIFVEEAAQDPATTVWTRCVFGLAALLDYDRQGPEDREYVTCDVIGRDTSGFVRAIQIDCGRRDGVDIFDPVVTELGMVGRVVKISATGAEVLLLTDLNSSVNARLQESRADGLVVGQLAGDLLMQYIPVTAGVSEGDLVVTNGLGQNFPADLLLGRVMSVSLSQNELYQEARVRSLVDFDRLEIVQVVVNFEPVDLAVFEDEVEGEGAATP